MCIYIQVVSGDSWASAITRSLFPAPGRTDHRQCPPPPPAYLSIYLSIYIYIYIYISIHLSICTHIHNNT